MPAEIRGGPSRTHRLPNQAEAEAAERALQAKLPPPTRRPLPPPQPLPPDMLPPAQEEPPSLIGQALYGQPGQPAEPPAEDTPEPLSGAFTVRYEGDDVHVTLWAEDGKRAFTGVGASLTEALSVAAGKLEEGLQQPVCPHCGQLMPTEA